MLRSPENQLSAHAVTKKKGWTSTEIFEYGIDVGRQLHGNVLNRQVALNSGHGLSGQMQSLETQTRRSISRRERTARNVRQGHEQ